MIANLFDSLALSKPLWLWLLPILILGSFLLRRIQRFEWPDIFNDWQTHRYVHPFFHILSKLSKPHSDTEESSRRWWHEWWRWLVFVCMILALSQPERIGQRLPDPPMQRDIVFIVDTSVGMMLRDYVLDKHRIDRMTLLKGILGRFVTNLHGDRISIVVYGDEAYTLVPLTPDHRLVQRMLSRIETGMAGRTNAMGEAVALAVKEANQATPSSSTTFNSDSHSKRRRVLVLFSQGARPTGQINPQEAAALAAEAHLTLYTIAIGAGSANNKEDKKVQLLYDPSDLERLKAMAERTGGKRYWANDTESLSSAIGDIAHIEQDSVIPPPRYDHQPLYQWPLLAGLLLLTVVQLIDIFRSRQWN